MEYHPRISLLSPSIREPRIILGSFPTWALSSIDSEKQRVLFSKGDFPYFYGSSINQFWNWYSRYVDSNLITKDINSIVESLERNSIGITDMILSCNRRGRSSLDKHLTNRKYNHDFFTYPKQGEVLKILCTSKGVMNEMLLTKNFLKKHPRIKVDNEASDILQNHFLREINCNTESIRNPIYRLLEVEAGGIIECMATPSPGSPYRRLIDFGGLDVEPEAFLANYLKLVFDWFRN